MPRWRPTCLRGSIYSESPGRPSASECIETDHPGEWQGSLILTLKKREGCSLGLTFSGGVDKGQRPHVTNLRPGSVAHRCDSLMVGDLIVSVNEIQISSLRHEEIINLLKNAGVNVTLEIHYIIPNKGPLSPNIQVKQCEVTLDKEQSGFGLTLRGGMLVDSMRSHPFTVMAFRAGGPVHREGSIKVGDQILAINGCKVAHLSLGEILTLMSQCESSASFTVAYETAVMDAIRTSSGPLEVEIDRCSGSDIGVTLSTAYYEKKPCMCVGFIQPMSVADRSGALQEGDHILSIDGVGVEAMSLAEAGQLLKAGERDSIRLEIVSATHLDHCANREILTNNSLGLSQSVSSHLGAHPSNKSAIIINHNNNNNNNSYNTNSLHRGYIHQDTNNHISSTSGGSSSGASTSDRSNHHHSSPVHSFNDNSSCISVGGGSQYGTLNLRKQAAWGQKDYRRATSCMSIASSSASVLSNPNQVCHAEVIEVILFTDLRGSLGLTLHGGLVSNVPLAQAPSIGYVEPRSPAYKCGVLQEGDRILAVNGMETMDRTLEEVNRYMRESRPRCVLLVEFDVTESVVPSSGTFVVKLVKRAGETGITINASTSSKNGLDSLFVSDVRRGSVAQRSGSIQAGDKLLAINDVRLTRCTNDDAMHLLELPDDIVKLKLSRDDPDEGNEGFIVYTVELQRNGGALGITISGTEDPYDPIIISELTPDGLAEKTGAIHVGDKLLAVSGDTTKNKQLSEAIRMLQTAGDIVTLKIARPDPSPGKDSGTLQPSDLGYSTPIPSIDSALESWDSSAFDPGSPQHNGSCDMDAVTTPTYYDSCDSRQQGRNQCTENVISLATPTSDGQNGWHHTDSECNQDSSQTDHNSWDFNGDRADKSRDKSSEDGLHNGADDDTHIDDWVKTLEDLDIGSGSEMLRQIGFSLRQRSDINVDETKDPSSLSKHRSRSSSQLLRGQLKVATASSYSSIDDMSPSSSLTQNSETHSSNQNRDLSNKPANEIYATPVRRSKRPAVTPKPASLRYSKSSSLPPRSNPPSSSTPMSADSVSPNTSGRENLTKTLFTPTPVQLQKIILEKDEKGFGFSLSDGLYEKGVFISAVNVDSCAEAAGLKQYDRVLQVGKVKVQDLECNQVVPLVAESGKKLNLIVCRNPLMPPSNTSSGQEEDSNKLPKQGYKRPPIVPPKRKGRTLERN